MPKAKEVQETAQKKEQSSAQETSQSSMTPSRFGRVPVGRRVFPSPLSLDPFSYMRRFSEEMDRLFEDAGWRRGPAWNQGSSSGWTPRVETFERAGKFVVRAELPGVKKDEVNVEVSQDGIVTIQGERKNQHEEKGEGFYRSECSYGHFYRSLPLPEGVTADSATARFQDGILEIEMDSIGPAQPKRRIAIQEGAQNR
jgi:HSP20 family protein